MLPNNYQLLEYIESSGTQWVDTLYTPNDKTKIDITFETDNIENNNTFLFGAGTGYQSGEAFEIYPRSHAWEVNYGPYGPFLGTAIANKKINIVVDAGDIYVDGQLLYQPPQHPTFTSRTTLGLFCLHRYSTYITPNHIKLYKVILYDNGVKTLDLYPCYRVLDGVTGLYDTVNSVFYINSGTGEFIRGPLAMVGAKKIDNMRFNSNLYNIDIDGGSGKTIVKMCYNREEFIF